MRPGGAPTTRTSTLRASATQQEIRNRVRTNSSAGVEPSRVTKPVKSTSLPALATRADIASPDRSAPATSASDSSPSATSPADVEKPALEKLERRDAAN